MWAIAIMRVMAAQAGGLIGGGLVLLDLLEVGILVAFGAEGRHRLGQQVSLIGSVWLMAGGAIALGGRLVFRFGFGDLFLEVIVTLVAQLAGRFDQELLVVRLVRGMAGGALAIFDRLMFGLGFGQ